ncbi:Tellurite resistance protein TerB, partial [Rhizobium ruizarguesonis]
MNKPLYAHDALIYVMMMASAVDSKMNDRELERIGQLIGFMPVFRDFDDDKPIAVARDCASLLAG